MHQSGIRGFGGLRGWLGASVAALGLLIGGACADNPLQKVPTPTVVLDNEMALQGTVCASPPVDAVFPLKILFLVDVSGSMVVTDPAKVRVQGLNAVINKYEGLAGVEFGVITFNSALTVVTKTFTATPDLGAVDTAAAIEDDLTDTQGVLGAAYEMLSQDMEKASAADRARSKYLIIFFTDGIPDPVCSADTTTCGTSTCQPGTHCVPTTTLSSQNQEQENYDCAADYLICSVPKMNWATAFNPPVPTSLYPELQDGANYNTMSQILTAVNQIMALQTQYHVGTITLNTNLLFPVAALSNPLATPFALDRPYAEELLMAMASAGNGQFQEFTDDTQINFLNLDFSTVQVQNSIVQSYASNSSAVQTGGALIVDTDGDGLSDAQEQSLGTCVAVNATNCKTPGDTDGDGYSDFIEVTYKTSGFDPLNPKLPATPCQTIGLDTDGDGLTDCEEAFLGTDPTNPDTDGDFLSDYLEVHSGTNPLDASDANGDINKDGILNEAELQMQLSAADQVSASERQFALTYTLQMEPAASGTTGTCYSFLVEHLRLLTTASTLLEPKGDNRLYYDVFETAADNPTNFSTVRRACADVTYIDGKVKLPLTGTVNFVDSDFVDIRTFDPAMNCKNLTQATSISDAGDGGG